MFLGAELSFVVKTNNAAVMGAIPGSAAVHKVYHVVTFKPHSDNLAKSSSARPAGILYQHCSEQCSVKCKFFCPNSCTSCYVVIVWASLLILFSLKCISMTVSIFCIQNIIMLRPFF